MIFLPIQSNPPATQPVITRHPALLPAIRQPLLNAIQAATGPAWAEVKTGTSGMKQFPFSLRIRQIHDASGHDQLEAFELLLKILVDDGIPEAAALQLLA